MGQTERIELLKAKWGHKSNRKKVSKRGKLARMCVLRVIGRKGLDTARIIISSGQSDAM